MKSTTFRPQDRELTNAEKNRIERIKTLAEQMEAEIRAIAPAGGTTRYTALAMTKLEECVMWAEKGATE